MVSTTNAVSSNEDIILAMLWVELIAGSQEGTDASRFQLVAAVFGAVMATSGKRQSVRRLTLSTACPEPHRRLPPARLFVFRNKNHFFPRRAGLGARLGGNWGGRVTPTDCPRCGGTGYVAKPVDISG